MLLEWYDRSSALSLFSFCETAFEGYSSSCAASMGMWSTGCPRVVSQLLERLQHDFPLVPEVLGNLVPHQVNLWIGAAPEGMSRPVQVAAVQRISCPCMLALDRQLQS